MKTHHIHLVASLSLVVAGVLAFYTVIGSCFVLIGAAVAALHWKAAKSGVIVK